MQLSLLSFKLVQNDKKQEGTDWKSCDTDPFIQKKQTTDKGEMNKQFDVFS